MRFSRSWLTRHLATSWSSSQLADAMTAFGAEIEGMEEHPDGDKDDTVFEVNVTPNRGDWAGVRGLARDLAVQGAGSLIPLPEIRSFRTAGPSSISLAPIDDASIRHSGCQAFYGRSIKKLKNCPSPDWLQRLLRGAGVTPRSMLVDVTNFLTIDLCRPAHAYDAHAIKGPIGYRASTPQESFEVLNGTQLTMPAGVGLITDAIGPVAVAGVIGGMRGACADSTTETFLELAYFDPSSVARSGRLVGITTDARYRFERGVDPQILPYALDYLTQLILETCGGEASEVVKSGHPPDRRTPITYHFGAVEQLIGVAVAPQEQQRILSELGFVVTGTDTSISVTPPSWRYDVSGRADIVEEVIRSVGYDRLMTKPLPPLLPETSRQRFEPMVRHSSLRRSAHFSAARILASRGYHESVTWSFALQAGAVRLHQRHEGLAIANPISVELDQLRPSILPNLVTCASTNISRAERCGALFEVGPVFSREGATILEHESLAALRFGSTSRKSWRNPEREVSFFDLREDLEMLLAALRLPSPNVLRHEGESNALFHPFRSGVVELSGRVIGVIGELHPNVLRAIDTSLPMAGFELEMAPLVNLMQELPIAPPAFARQELLPIERDLSLIVSSSTPVESLLLIIKKELGAQLRTVRVFDIYAGEKIPAGKKSVGITFVLNQRERSLTAEEIDQICRGVVASLSSNTGAELRAG